MTFAVGSWVRWKDVSTIRLGYAASDIGQVVRAYSVPDGESELDVEFAGGDILHGAIEHWFEAAEAPAKPGLSFELEAAAS